MNPRFFKMIQNLLFSPMNPFFLRLLRFQTNENLSDDLTDEEVFSELDPDVGAVVSCYDPAMSFRKMFKAANYLMRKDCLFLASDIDASFPISLQHILPGERNI